MVVGVVRGNDTLALRAYGEADVEHGVAATPETVFHLASVSKQFTAAAILRLADRGRLSLEDDLGRYVPEYVTNGRRVALHHLLAHTHGMQEYNRPEVHGEFPLPFGHRRFLELMKDQQFDFPVGERYLYRNTGYYFAAMIIEQLGGREGATGGGAGPIIGRRYGDFLREEFFAPLGMTRTVDCRDRPIIKGRARGYASERGTLVNAMTIDWTWALGVGSLCATAGDLVRWTRALHDGRVLTPASYRRMITPATLNDGTRTSYGLGLAVGEVGGHRVYAHDGGAPGFSTHLAYYPDRRLTVVVLTNHEAGGAGPLGKDLALAVLAAEP
jgi:CubicO group peptidase (beta-lactamase class C family)